MMKVTYYFLTFILMYVLHIEDEVFIYRSLSRFLKPYGYTLEFSFQGNNALTMLSTQDYQFVILDLRLGSRSGLDLIREIRRQHPDLKIIIISGLTDAKTVVKALDLGADEFIGKPYNPNEVRARLDGLKRRPSQQTVMNCHSINGVEFHAASSTLSYRNKTVHLTRVERHLLQVLLQSYPQAINYETITSRLWGRTGHGKDLNTVRVQMHRLRQKFKKLCPRQNFIRTCSQQGYQLCL